MATAPACDDFDLVCPITQDVFEDPVTAADGCVYERRALECWISQRGAQPLLSPLKNTPMSAKVTPNDAIKRRALAWRQKHGSGARDTKPRLQILNSSIFESLDKVADLIAPLNLQHPTIIATGNENAGKSTLLESVTGFPVLPRDVGLTTKMVIRVALRRGPAKLATVSVWKRKTGTSAACEVEKSMEVCALEVLCTLVQKKMNAEVQASATPIVMDRELRITIQVEYCPSLNLVDLPGFVTVHADGRFPELTMQLAKQVIEEEKESAIFLLVVEAVSAPNVSLATSVLKSANVLDRTLGVFTKGDKVNDDIQNDRTRGQVLGSLVRGESSGTVPLRKGWAVCCNMSPSTQVMSARAVGSREVFRLHFMREKEEKYLSGLGLDDDVKARCGMPQVIQLIQSFFEEFITTNWIPKIREAMMAHYKESSTMLYELGVPLPNSTEYEPVLKELRPLAAKSIPGFDANLVSTKDNTEFKALLLCCVKSTLQHPANDWLNMTSRPLLFAKPTVISTAVETAKKDWATSQFYLTTAAKMRQAEADLRSESNALVAALKSMCDARRKDGIIELLLGVLSEKPPKPNVGLMNKFWSVFQTASSEDQASLAQLYRKPQLLAEFKKHLCGVIKSLEDAFDVKAKELIDAELKEFAVAVHAPGPPVKSTAVFLRPVETANLGHRILDLFFKVVVFEIETVIQNWSVPATAIQEDKATVVDRVAALNKMLTAAQVLTKLLAMEESIGKAAA